jgi:hypothetical protein
VTPKDPQLFASLCFDSNCMSAPNSALMDFHFEDARPAELPGYRIFES